MAQGTTKIPSPSAAANSQGVYPYTMDESETFSGSRYPEEIIDWIKTITEEKAFQSLVINCHGAPARLKIGAHGGFGWGNLALWSHLRDSSGGARVKTIYLVSCGVVSFTGSGDGNLFCGAIAKNARAYVVASDKNQKPAACPKGFIDNYEGGVWIYAPDGSNRSWDGKPKVR